MLYQKSIFFILIRCNDWLKIAIYINILHTNIPGMFKTFKWFSKTFNCSPTIPLAWESIYSLFLTPSLVHDKLNFFENNIFHFKMLFIQHVKHLKILLCCVSNMHHFSNQIIIILLFGIMVTGLFYTNCSSCFFNSSFVVLVVKIHICLVGQLTTNIVAYEHNTICTWHCQK